MSVTSPAVNGNVPIERTWRVNLETPYAPAGTNPPPYSMQIYRERLLLDSAGTLISKERVADVNASFAALAADTLTLVANPTIAQLMEALKTYFDSKAEAAKAA